MVEHNKKHDKGNVGHRRGLNQFSDLTSEEFLHRNHGNKTGLFLPIGIIVREYRVSHSEVI